MGREAKNEGAQAQLDELSALAPVLHVRCECNGASWDRDFHAGAFVVGRHELLSLRFPSDGVSQFHAQIELNMAKQQWSAKELGSSNGSTLNGKKLRSDRRTGLKVGDKLEFAGTGSIEVLKVRPRWHSLCSTSTCQLGGQALRAGSCAVSGPRAGGHTSHLHSSTPREPLALRRGEAGSNVREIRDFAYLSRADTYRLSTAICALQAVTSNPRHDRSRRPCGAATRGGTCELACSLHRL